METTTNSMPCIAYKVISSNGADNMRSDVALGVSFAVAFVVGALLALIASSFLFRYLAKKGAVESSTAEEKDVESDDFKSARVDFQQFKRVSTALNKEKQDWHDESLEGLGPKSFHISLDAPPLGAGNCVCLCDIISLPNYSESKASLLRSQMLAALRLEKNLTEEKINVKILCARDVLLSQLQRSKITKFQYHDAMGRFLRALSDKADSVHRELELKQNELRKAARELSPLLEIESLKQYSAYLVRLNLATESLGEVFKRSVSSLPHLTPTEVNGITVRFFDQSVKLDSGLNVKRFQQMNFLDELYSRRMGVIENLQLQWEYFETEAMGRQNVLSKVLQSLDTVKVRLTEKQKSAISCHFMDIMKSHHYKLSQEMHEKLSALALNLQHIHRENLTKMTEAQKKHRNDFIANIESYMELLNAVRRQRNEMKRKLDQEDSEAIDAILREHEHSCQKILDGIDDSLRDACRKQGRLSEEDAAAIWRQYEAQLQQELKMIKLERRDKHRQIMGNYSSDRAAESKSQQLKDEELKIKVKLDKLMFGVFRTQTLLSTEGRQKVQKYHDENVVGMCNRLLLAKFRNDKIVKWLKQLQKQTTGNFPNAADGSTMVGGKKKSLFSLFSRNSEAKLKKQRVTSGASFEKTAATSEELFLAEGRRNEVEFFEKYETDLAKFIGHQVAAEARQRALRSIRQDTTIDKIGNQIVKTLDVESEDQRESDGLVDVFAQQHLTEVSEIIEEFCLSKLRQDELIEQKVESKQHTKERDIASEFNRRSRKPWQENNLINEHFEQTGVQLLFQDSLIELKQESVVEVESLKEDVFSELYAELRHQLAEEKKGFLAQVMALTKMTKETIETAVSNAIHEAGGNDREALKLTKEILLEVQRVRLNSGLRQQPSTKSSKYISSSPRVAAKSYQRSKTEHDFRHPRQSPEMPRRDKTSFNGFQNQSYLDSDDESSLMHRNPLPQRPQSAFRKSAEV